MLSKGKNSTNGGTTKRLSAEATLSYLFSQPALLQDLVRYSDENTESKRKFGFSQYTYESLMAEKMSYLSNADKVKYRTCFEIENLYQANLIVEWDKGQNRIVFHNSVIELVRMTDERLIKDLTNAA